MNRIKDLVIQFCKFGAVGGLCFGIDYGLMIFLTETHIMHYFASSAVSFTVSVIVNYILSMRFVFIGKEDMTKAQEMVIFVALSMIGLVMNQMIMWFAVEHLGMYLQKKIPGSISRGWRVRRMYEKEKNCNRIGT